MVGQGCVPGRGRGGTRGGMAGWTGVVPGAVVLQGSYQGPTRGPVLRSAKGPLLMSARCPPDVRQVSPSGVPSNSTAGLQPVGHPAGFDAMTAVVWSLFKHGPALIPLRALFLISG